MDFGIHEVCALSSVILNFEREERPLKNKCLSSSNVKKKKKKLSSNHLFKYHPFLYKKFFMKNKIRAIGKNCITLCQHSIIYEKMFSLRRMWAINNSLLISD